MRPLTFNLELHPGEMQTVKYLVATPRTGRSPARPFQRFAGQAAQHFDKIECFCFSQQTLAPGRIARDAAQLHRQTGNRQGYPARDFPYSVLQRRLQTRRHSTPGVNMAQTNTGSHDTHFRSATLDLPVHPVGGLFLLAFGFILQMNKFGLRPWMMLAVSASSSTCSSTGSARSSTNRRRRLPRLGGQVVPAMA